MIIASVGTKFDFIVTKQTITLFLILSLLSSVMSVALSTAEQFEPSFAKQTKELKLKKTTSNPLPNFEDKPKDDSKSKDDGTDQRTIKSNDDKDKSNDQSTSKENDDAKGDDATST